MNAAVCRRAVFCVPRWLHRRPGSAGGEGRPAPRCPVRSAGIGVHLGEGVGDASTFAIRCLYLHVTPGWQYIRPASCLDSIPLGVGREMATREWVLRSVSGDLTLRKTHDLKWANAPTPVVSAPRNSAGGWVAPERWRPLGSGQGVGCR